LIAKFDFDKLRPVMNDDTWFALKFMLFLIILLGAMMWSFGLRDLVEGGFFKGRILKRSANWPTAKGHVVDMEDHERDDVRAYNTGSSLRVYKTGDVFRSISIVYSYSVNGAYYSGRDGFAFRYKDDDSPDTAAARFKTVVRDQDVLVRYNPTRPEQSVLDQAFLQTLVKD
jgi:hypothetical protein